MTASNYFYSPTFQNYTKVLSSEDYSPLTVEKEKELLAQYANGSKEAFDKIVKAYLRFVVFLIKGYKIPYNLDIMDVVQEGNLGFIIGLSKFDSTRYDCRVSTYCKFWVKFFINKALTANAKVENVFDSINEDESIEERIVADDEIKLREKIYEDITTYGLNKLNAREQFIIKAYYGLETPFIPKTLQEIASICHIDIERIRQLKVTALEKLNKEMISRLAHD
ncbi:MAG: sigma-70 family RNA polymerase sigma factor [Novosphingobium sp.]|nr:sigma-70 family RNA polymerase sigma factor [Novosphingobium sp.]